MQVSPVTNSIKNNLSQKSFHENYQGSKNRKQENSEEHKDEKQSFDWNKEIILQKKIAELKAVHSDAWKYLQFLTNPNAHKVDLVIPGDFVSRYKEPKPVLDIKY